MRDANGNPRSELTNRQLLDAADGVLRGLDGQRRFCLKRAMVKWRCPACGDEHTRIEASGLAFEDFNPGYPPADGRYKCPTSGIALMYYLTILGDEGFTLTEPVTATLARAAGR